MYRCQAERKEKKEEEEEDEEKDEGQRRSRKCGGGLVYRRKLQQPDESEDGALYCVECGGEYSLEELAKMMNTYANEQMKKMQDKYGMFGEAKLSKQEQYVPSLESMRGLLAIMPPCNLNVQQLLEQHHRTAW